MDSSSSKVKTLQVVQNYSLYRVLHPTGVGLIKVWVRLSSTTFHQPFSKTPQNRFTRVIFQVWGCPAPFWECSEETSRPLTPTSLTYHLALSLHVGGTNLSLPSPTFSAFDLRLLHRLTHRPVANQNFHNA